MDWGIFRPTKPAALCLCLLGVSFLLMTFHWTAAVKNFRAFLLYWISPVHAASNLAAQAASEPGRNLLELIRSHEENAALKQRILKSSLLETQYKDVLAENKRLRELLELKGSLPFDSVSARVSGRDPQSWAQAVWIDRGTKDQVKPDSPVVAVLPEAEDGAAVVKGLIGRVLETAHRTSKVLLVTDPLSSIAVSLPRTGEQGLVQGQGSHLSLEYLEMVSQVQPGDEVVTSGLGGIFPPGLPVGTLTQVELSPSGFRRGVVKPAVSLNAVREVLVLKLERPR